MRYESTSRDPAPNPEYERGVADVRRKELARIGYTIPANASPAYVDGVYGVATKRGQVRADAAPRFLDPMDLVFAGGAEARSDASGETATPEETESSADDQRAAGFAQMNAKFERGLANSQYGYRPAAGHQASYPGGSRGSNASTPPNDGPYGESARQSAPRVPRESVEHASPAFGGGNMGDFEGSFGGGQATPDTFGEGTTTDARDAMIARARDAWRTPQGKPKARAMGRTRGAT
jgi:hypothetical protein